MFHTIFKVCNLFFLLLFPIGIGGNCLNLWVLLSKEFRSSTNLLLAGVALCDVGFLAAMLPMVAMQYETIRAVPLLFTPYDDYRPQLMATINWLSAASIWLIVLVSLERLLVVWRPMRARHSVGWRRVVVSIVGVLALTFLLTLHNHFQFIVVYPPASTSDNTTNTTSADVPSAELFAQRKRTVRPNRKAIYTALMTANIVVVVVLPFIILTTTSWFLVQYLRTHNAEIQVLVKQEAPPSELSASNMNIARLSIPTAVIRKSTSATSTTGKIGEGSTGRNCKSERKVTLLVVLIVICFALTQLPSGILHAVLVVTGFTYTKVQFLYFLTQVGNMLVSLGKIVNFLLLCTVSVSFRKRIKTLWAKRKATANRRFSPTTIVSRM